jgi:hypothetical protein
VYVLWVENLCWYSWYLLCLEDGFTVSNVCDDVEGGNNCTFNGVELLVMEL